MTTFYTASESLGKEIEVVEFVVLILKSIPRT